MKNLFYLLLVLTVSISACKKGDTGSAGTDGNANVKSYQITVKSADWSSSSLLGINAYPKLAALTDSVLNYGAVILYVKSGTNGWIEPAILSYYYGITKTTDAGSYIWISYKGSSVPTNDVIFRAIVITGEAGITAKSNNNLSFEVMKEKYNLKD
jgi:hypothetical protein